MLASFIELAEDAHRSGMVAGARARSAELRKEQ